MKTIGLTGCLGAGKSFMAEIFRQEGIPVFDADACGRTLLAEDKKVYLAVAAVFPGVTGAGTVDRERLASLILANPGALEKLESILHPKILEHAVIFLKEARREGRSLAVLEVPLLFEAGWQKHMDLTMCVEVPFFERWRRVKNRPGMTWQKFRFLCARQMPSKIKSRHADFVLSNAGPKAQTQKTVRQLIRCLKQKEDQDGS